jgi:hypothetical protein
MRLEEPVLFPVIWVARRATTHIARVPNARVLAELRPAEYVTVENMRYRVDRIDRSLTATHGTVTLWLSPMPH